MPELIEVELYRKFAARTVGRTVSSVLLPRPQYLRKGTNLEALRMATRAQPLKRVRRIGKLLILDIGKNSVGLRFGMTGRLIVDGETAIERLLYTTPKVEADHLPFVMSFEQGGELAIVDPRRFGSVELQPNETILGPDADKISREELGAMLQNSKTALKALLLNQRKVAGLGNLLCDEILWRAGIDPHRRSHSLEVTDIDELDAAISGTIKELTQRGGSHMGDIQDQRRQAGICPKDGTELQRSTLGGRTTWWCPEHQR